MPLEVSEIHENQPAPMSPSGAIIAKFPLNERGRDFVVGDIHGMFSHLSALLNDEGFSAETDRLFSVGDLVDRGPESAQALAWLDLPWFHACRGNHEQFALDSGDPEQLELWVNHNGGAWWLQLDEEQHIAFRAAFRRLPLAMEIETQSGTVGIVHADVPPLLSWDRFAELLEAKDEDAALYALWSRNGISGNCTHLPVTGRVERVYCGHTPTRGTVQLHNVYYIDTGAVYIQDGYQDAKLTMIEVQPERHRECVILTNREV